MSYVNIYIVVEMKLSEKKVSQLSVQIHTCALTEKAPV